MTSMNTSNSSKTTQTATTDGCPKRFSVAKVKADTFALELIPVLKELTIAGIVSPTATAAALNERGIPTARGGKWAITTVTNLIGRLAVINAEVADAARKKMV